MDKLSCQRATSLLLLAATSLECAAAQRKEVWDGVAVEAVISQLEVTRIRVEHAMISGVVGKIQSASGCGAPTENTPITSQPQQPQTPAAEMSVTCDLAKGEIYVRPLGEGKRPINLFVSTDRATYTLVLRRADIPSDTITLFDPASRAMASRADGARPRQAGHVKNIKAMVRAMAATRTPDDIQVEDVNVPLQLWREASFTLMRNYRGRGLLGERYLLTNTSAAPLTVTEQEFDREGANVQAVSVENHNLRPGDTTWVYVIRTEVQP